MNIVKNLLFMVLQYILNKNKRALQAEPVYNI